MKYAIVDIETTGGNAKTGKITEIALFVHDGEKVIDEFTSLVNPECDIPPFITSLTGISNKMVKDAPKFYEIAKKIVEVTEDCVIVAHNSEFDYSFIKQEFQQLGYKYRKNTLCSVEMSRRLIPNCQSYSLGKLCKELGIDLNGRHRAYGDAEATVKLFEMMLEKEYVQAVMDEVMRYDLYNAKIHANIKREVIDQLPDETGVYYLYDENEELIYIGKSKNIRKRILQHLSNTSTQRAQRMARGVRNIDFVLTGSELIALLLESDEIKKHQPRYNRAQRKTKIHFGIYKALDDKGYINFQVAPIEMGDHPVTTAFSRQEGTRLLEKMSERFNLCQKLCGLYKAEKSCFQYQIKQCKGACVQEESVESYNQRAEKASQIFSYGVSNVMLIDEGRHAEERAVVQIENGMYKGFGYIEVNGGVSKIDELKAVIKPYKDNKDVNKIIRGYLRKKKLEKQIQY
ncbi:exonuclease domain-containing protein [Limibacter armeniacum]|uniref:exonuclease domain-containing protein n=1 Tax=Limibacter armeniacum TaxID=466084 RepID=UPI002FE66691